jgi:hypothetical protein
MTLVFSNFLRVILPPNGTINVFLLTLIQIAVFFVIARLLGIGVEDLRQEKEVFRAILNRSR